MNLRERIESDLGLTVEGPWGLPVNLISPDGIRQTKKANSDDQLLGQVLYDIVRMNPDTGEDIVVDTPVVTLRRSSLIRVPAPGENWIVEIPEHPSMSAPMIAHVISPVRPPEGGKSLGIIRLYLQKVEQS